MQCDVQGRPQPASTGPLDLELSLPGKREGKEKGKITRKRERENEVRDFAGGNEGLNAEFHLRLGYLAMTSSTSSGELVVHLRLDLFLKLSHFIQSS